MDPEVQQMGIQLAEIGIRNAGSAVTQKIHNIKAKRDDKETIKVLEEIINDLVNDKNELVRIAQSFEEELVAQRISDEDIQFISGHLVPLLNELDPNSSDLSDTISKILSVESVTVFQLLGFNFRRALGEPLTELVAEWISAQTPTAKKKQNSKR